MSTRIPGFDCNTVAGFESADGGADGVDGAGRFVTHNQRVGWIDLRTYASVSPEVYL